MYSEYQDSIDQAAQVARTAIPLAAKLNLPINPIIYAVFYQHVAEVNTELSQAFKDLMAGADGLSKEAVESLYQTYIYKNDATALEALRTTLGNMITSTHGVLSQAENESKAYQQCLGSATEQLRQNKGFDSIESIVASLISETEHMHEASKKLRDELSEANNRIEQMHADFSRIRHESLTDPLTGLKNRRAFDRDIEEQCQKTASGGEALSLLVIDIDYFKKINDTYGHLLGDAVLKWVAQIIKESVRGTDIPARFGGEEFVLVLPNTDLTGAQSVAENIRNNIAKRNLKHGDTAIGKTTVSIGVSRYKSDETVADLIQRADTALYKAKEAGRNRVVVNP